MPGERLLHGLHLRLCGSLLSSESTAEACGSLLLLEYGLYLLTILRNDGLLTLEILSVEVLTQITVCKDGITAVGLGNGL